MRCKLIHSEQVGEPRNCKETAETTVEQLVTSTQPFVSTSLAETARKTGVKDTIAQPIIENLVKLGQELRKGTPEQAARSPDEIMTILADELTKAHHQGGVLNPLIDMDGVLICRTCSRARNLLINLLRC